MTAVESETFVHHGVAMQLKIGVMGAATGEFEAAHRAAAYNLGEAIARAGCITITGGCPGLPLEAARGAKAIRSSDMVVIVGGRSGTLGELAIAYDEGKLIGVLVGTGGITDLIRSIFEACRKDTSARVTYDADPHRLVEEMLRLYRTQHYRRPSCFCDENWACDGNREATKVRA